ncbi:MAG: hypothetical protein QF888_01490 [Desulfobacterales bacterium]|nr:hypothetical protein [Desulfobacterales bacterium]
MPDPKCHPLSAEYICQALCKKGLISQAQEAQIRKNGKSIQKKLEKDQARPNETSSVGGRIPAPITIIDVIVSINLQRTGDPSKRLGEEIVFQTLTDAWRFPFRKMDPLKLDLNLVTTTIPRNFAMRHLVLPIAVKDGLLTVATPNPFNTEVFQDISQASLLKVKPVVSPKTDIIKLIGEFFRFKRSIMKAEHQFADPLVDLGNLEQYVRLQSPDELPANDQHIVNAVNYLFSYAFDQQAHHLPGGIDGYLGELDRKGMKRRTLSLYP